MTRSGIRRNEYEPQIDFQTAGEASFFALDDLSVLARYTIDGGNDSRQARCGETMDDLLEAYPSLTAGGVQAALAFAADLLRDEIHVIPISQGR